MIQLNTDATIVRSRAILIILLLLLMGCRPRTVYICCPRSDLTVKNIEITQAIQTTTNTVTLVAQRSTAVRVTIGTGNGSVSGVTGKLHVFVDGAVITPAGGLSPINAPLMAPASPERGTEDHTLNFELLCPSGITSSTDVDFRVDITPVVGETNTGNNSGQVNNLTFVNRKTPSLFFTRINFAGLGLPALALVQPGVGDAFVRGIYPVNDCDPNLYRQVPSITYGDANGNGILDAGSEVNNLLSLLASYRQLIVFFGLGASDNTFLYGWIAGNPISGNGWGQISGFAAFGNTQPIRHQRTYAHELGHNFGLGHNSRTLAPEVGWDVGARLHGNPGTNNTTGWVKPMTLNDIMRGGQLTNSAWVDTITYNFFLGSSILSASADVGGDQLPGTGILIASADVHGHQFPVSSILSAYAAAGGGQEKSSERVLVIQGIFNPEGNALVSLEPAFRFPWRSQPTSVRQEGRFAAEVTDEAGNVTRVHFDALVADDSEDGKEVHGFFEVMVAVPPDLEVASVRIIDAKDGRVLGGFKRSKPTTIVIVAPQGGARLGAKTKVAWKVKDPDTPEDKLLYQIAYSPDGGRRWVPIAADVPGTTRSIVFDSTEIPPSTGNGVIRVFVSDGLNTAFADASKLTTAK